MSRYNIALGKKPPKKVKEPKKKYVPRRRNMSMFYNVKIMYDYMSKIGGTWCPIITDPPIYGYRKDFDGESVEISVESYNATKHLIPKATIPNINSTAII